MTRLLTKNIATMTELREPQKVLDRANGEPVAILKNSKAVAYIVPAEHLHAPEDGFATWDEFEKAFADTAAEAQPVLDYLKDK